MRWHKQTAKKNEKELDTNIRILYTVKAPLMMW